MRSGGGVLCVSTLQLVVGLILLGIYEAYKVSTFLTSHCNVSVQPLIKNSNVSFGVCGLLELVLGPRRSCISKRIRLQRGTPNQPRWQVWEVKFPVKAGSLS